MNNQQWYKFFSICATHLGTGAPTIVNSDNWCSWITFDRLEEDVRYWTSGLPKSDELNETSLQDGGVWGHPFLFNEIAHIILPKKFFGEACIDGKYQFVHKEQNIENISDLLTNAGIEHRCTDKILEIKLY